MMSFAGLSHSSIHFAGLSTSLIFHALLFLELQNNATLNYKFNII